MAMITFAVNNKAVEILRGEVTRAIGRSRRIESDFNPVRPSSIYLGLSVGICGEIGMNYDIAGAQHVRVFGSNVGIGAWVVFADKALGDSFELVDGFPFRRLVSVAIKDTFCSNFIGGFAGRIVGGWLV